MVDKELIMALFKDLSEEEICCLTEIMQTKRVSAGELIYEQDSLGETLFGIVEGKVSLYCLIGQKGRQTQKQVIKTLSKNDFFGLLSFFDLKKHLANARAEQDCLLLFMEKEQFNHLAKKKAEIGMKIIRRLVLILSASVRQMDKKLEGMLGYYYG